MFKNSYSVRTPEAQPADALHCVDNDKWVNMQAERPRKT